MLSQLYISNANGLNALFSQIGIALLIVLLMMPVHAIGLYGDVILVQVEIYRVGMDRVLLLIGHAQRVKRFSDVLFNARLAMKVFLAKARTEACRLFTGFVNAKHFTAMVARHRNRIYLRHIAAGDRTEASIVRPLVLKPLPALFAGGLNAQVSVCAHALRRAVLRIAVMPLRFLIEDNAAVSAHPLSRCFPRGVVARISAEQNACEASEGSTAVLAHIGFWLAWHNKTSLTRGADNKRWGRLVSDQRFKVVHEATSIPKYYTIFGIPVL